MGTVKECSSLRVMDKNGKELLYTLPPPLLLQANHPFRHRWLTDCLLISCSPRIRPETFQLISAVKVDRRVLNIRNFAWNLKTRKISFNFHKILMKTSPFLQNLRKKDTANARKGLYESVKTIQKISVNVVVWDPPAATTLRPTSWHYFQSQNDAICWVTNMPSI